MPISQLKGALTAKIPNFGTVTIDDAVYTELTETMTKVNAAAEQIHAKAVPAD